MPSRRTSAGRGGAGHADGTTSSRLRERTAGIARASCARMPGSHFSDPAALLDGAEAGFRCSTRDAAVLAAAALLAAVASWCSVDAAVVIVTIVGHFFVFCNVVRLRRSFELAWAACYTTAAAILTSLDAFHAGPLALAITPVTLILVALEVQSARYHGVGWQIVNPRWRSHRSG